MIKSTFKKSELKENKSKDEKKHSKHFRGISSPTEAEIIPFHLYELALFALK